MTSLLDYTPIFSLYLIWTFRAQNAVISSPRTELLALCLANNTRNQAELLENSHTKKAVINSSLAYAFNFCINKHCILSSKNQTGLDLSWKKIIRNQNKLQEIKHYLLEEKNNIPSKEFLQPLTSRSCSSSYGDKVVLFGGVLTVKCWCTRVQAWCCCIAQNGLCERDQMHALERMEPPDLFSFSNMHCSLCLQPPGAKSTRALLAVQLKVQ